MANRGGICYEPCTLVYTLIDNSEISFDDAFLIIRSLHTFMVDKIIPNPELNNVHVKLNYQASIANASAKLGELSQFIAVTKQSAYVKETELSRLDELRRRFNINASTSSDEPAAPAPAPRRYKAAKKPVFARPAPYKARKVTQGDESDDGVGHDPTDGF